MAVKKNVEVAIPASVRIVSMDYAIKFQENLYTPEGRPAWGLITPAQQTIELSPSSSPARLSSTIIHEILHGLFDEFELSDSDDEERIVSALSTGLVTVIRDNPALITALQKMVAAS